MKTNKVLIGVGALLLVGVLTAGWAYYRAGDRLPEGLLLANGRVEGDHVTVATKLAGRIAKMSVREGDEVVTGQVLAELEDTPLRARLAQAEAARAAADAQLVAARTQLEVLRQQIPLGIRSAEAGVDKARAASAQSAKDAGRFAELAARGSVDAHRAEQMKLAAVAADADARRAADALAEARLGERKLRAKGEEIGALEAQRRQAEAAVREVGSLVDDLTIRSPQAGVVLMKLREAGEVVAAGAPLFDLVDLDRLYLKAYVAEKEIGKLKLGLPARVYVDAFPERPFPATVRTISSRAEFTPKEVQTPDERVKLTYAVKLYFDANKDRSLSPGVPADAVIRWQEGVGWVKPKW